MNWVKELKKWTPGSWEVVKRWRGVQVLPVLPFSKNNERFGSPRNGGRGPWKRERWTEEWEKNIIVKRVEAFLYFCPWKEYEHWRPTRVLGSFFQVFRSRRMIPFGVEGWYLWYNFCRSLTFYGVFFCQGPKFCQCTERSKKGCINMWLPLKSLNT